LFTPGHAAPERPVTEILSQYVVLGRRSRGPCNMLVVKAYILCVSLGGLLGQFVGGTHTLFTPRHAAPEHPVIEILSQYIVLKEVVPYKAYCSPD